MYYSTAKPGRFMSIMPVREEWSADTKELESQAVGLNADRDPWGYKPRGGTGVPSTGPEYQEIRGQGLEAEIPKTQWKDTRSRSYKKELREAWRPREPPPTPICRTGSGSGSSPTWKGDPRRIG